ncbi:MAG: C40 family peptidase [Treponema sp.]|nr:C40 family peptidase [Treponema sp.]
MKAKFFLFSALCLIIFSSCTITVDFEDETGTFSAYVSAYSPYVTDGSYGSNQSNITNCPSPIAKSAFEYAKLYAASDTVYKLGAQDPLRSIQIDCSGLVIMCYKYALKNTGYSLVQSDMSSSYMYEHASIKTTTPRRGDLIFMGDSNSSKITHVAIFDRFEGDQVYFIDSTSVGRTTGVSERHYSRNDKRIKSYGIMKLKY